MTGRELIIYILQNNLEDEIFFKDGNIPGFINENQTASKFGVGAETIRTWYLLGWLDGMEIGGKLYFLNNVPDPRKKEK